MQPPIIKDKNQHPTAITSSHNQPQRSHVDEINDFLEATSVERKKRKEVCLKLNWGGWKYAKFSIKKNVEPNPTRQQPSN